MGSYNSSILTSVYGRRLGLQPMSSGQSGSPGNAEFLVGPDAARVATSTAETTSTQMKAYGISYIVGTSAASTPVYTLAPPIPGVKKGLFFGSTDSALYVKTANGEYIYGSSMGSSATTIRSSGGGFVELIGVTTAIWATGGISSTAVNTVAFQATT